MPRTAPASSLVTPSGASLQPVAASPSAAAGSTCFAETLAALRTDLELHRSRAVEIEALIAKLTAYTAAIGTPPAAEPSDEPSVPPNGRRSRPSISEDERLRRQRDAMRERRAAAKAAAKPSLPAKSKPAAKRPPPAPVPPPSKPARSHKAKARPELAEPQRQEIERIQAAIAAAHEESIKFKVTDRAKYREALDAMWRLRRLGGLFLRTLGQAKLPLAPHVLKSWRFAAIGSDEAFEEHLASLTPPIEVVGEFFTDVDGCLTRTKTTVDGKAAAPAPV